MQHGAVPHTTTFHTKKSLAEIGQRIVTLGEYFGYEEWGPFAKACGLARYTLLRMATTGAFSGDTLLKIWEHTGSSLDWLVCGLGTPNTHGTLKKKVAAEVVARFRHREVPARKRPKSPPTKRETVVKNRG